MELDLELIVSEIEEVVAAVGLNYLDKFDIVVVVEYFFFIAS